MALTIATRNNGNNPALPSAAFAEIVCQNDAKWWQNPRIEGERGERSTMEKQEGENRKLKTKRNGKGGDDEWGGGEGRK